MGDTNLFKALKPSLILAFESEPYKEMSEELVYQPEPSLQAWFQQ